MILGSKTLTQITDINVSNRVDKNQNWKKKVLFIFWSLGVASLTLEALHISPWDEFRKSPRCGHLYQPKLQTFSTYDQICETWEAVKGKGRLGSAQSLMQKADIRRY